MSDAATADRQVIGDLTVERVRTDTGIWWVWRRGGRQVHAAMGSRELVDGVQYQRCADGLWREVRET